jgi:ribosome-associated protein
MNIGAHKTFLHTAPRWRYTCSFLRRWIIAVTTEISKETNLTQSRQFAIDAARLLSDTRCHNVVVLDVTGISPVTDFLVVATGTSPVQMRSACDEVQELGEPRGFRALTRAGDSGTWTCIDLVDIVVHVFNHETRAYYDLDNLWGDARKVEWKRTEQR